MTPGPAKPKRSKGREGAAGGAKRFAPPKRSKPKMPAKEGAKKRAKGGAGAPKLRAKNPPAAEPAAPQPEADDANLITKPPIKRILKKAGCARISHDVLDEVRSIVQAYTERVLAATAVFTDHATRKTISTSDLAAGFRAVGLHVAMATATKKAAPKKKSAAPESKPDEAPGAKPKKPSNRVVLEIPHNNFKKLCKTLVNSAEKEYRFSANVVHTVQYIVEAYLCRLAALALLCARHANARQTVKAADFQLARELRGW